jgi:hypothetical protein
MSYLIVVFKNACNENLNVNVTLVKNLLALEKIKLHLQIPYIFQWE